MYSFNLRDLGLLNLFCKMRRVKSRESKGSGVLIFPPDRVFMVINGMSVEVRIRQKLQDHLHIELLEVINESPYHQVPEDSETHFRVLIVSKDFEGLSTVKRHQKVYKILEEELKSPVHAFSQRTFTPGEWGAMDLYAPSSPPCQKKDREPGRS